MLKKTVGFLSWTLVVITTVCLIFTLLTTYQLIPIQYFSNYKMFDIFMIFTMIVWAVNFFDNSDKSRNLFYSGGCAFIALGTMFFMYMGVF
ncbi:MULTISPECIES: hypothetical protein [Clostridium]|uniref:hypothetical protein n=1 Tax=Clostridium TaxID=1485 RepID=UPI00069CE360|nr:MULTISPECIES: hypothetical protein [Clostridium]KOF58097.1 membrane protein [Clostridium sp. DMHC 10]MCD2347739.1 hypothetical protein [Clostridium guangxiense]